MEACIQRYPKYYMPVSIYPGKERGSFKFPASANQDSGGASKSGVWAVYCFVVL